MFSENRLTIEQIYTTHHFGENSYHKQTTRSLAVVVGATATKWLGMLRGVLEKEWLAGTHWTGYILPQTWGGFGTTEGSLWAQRRHGSVYVEWEVD